MIASRTTPEVRVTTDEGEVKPHFSKLLQSLGGKIAFVKIEHPKGVLTLALKSPPGKHAGQRIHVRWSDGTEIVTPRRVTNETKIIETLRRFFQLGAVGDFFAWGAASEFKFDHDETSRTEFANGNIPIPVQEQHQIFSAFRNAFKEITLGWLVIYSIYALIALLILSAIPLAIFDAHRKEQERQVAAILAQEKAKKQREEQEVKAKYEAMNPRQPSEWYKRGMQKIEARKFERNIKAIREANGYED